MQDIGHHAPDTQTGRAIRRRSPRPFRAVRESEGEGSYGRAGAPAGGGVAAELALAVGDRAPWASALDNVLVCAGAHVDASSATALLRLLVPGVDVHARVAELSGGQRRRVEIARALLCPGGAVILDEPFTGLDTAARDACAEAVLDLLDGRMLLLATHDAADAQAFDISDITTL